MSAFEVMQQARFTLPEGTLIQVRFPEGHKAAKALDELVQVGALAPADWPVDKVTGEDIATRLVPIIAQLTPEDFTRAGTPKLAVVQAAVEDKITADDLAKAWDAFQASKAE